MTVRDDGVREHHGVASQDPGGGTVRVWEGEHLIVVRVWNGTGGTEQTITAAAARYLAGRLYDLADRVDRRLKPPLPLSPPIATKSGIDPNDSERMRKVVNARWEKQRAAKAAEGTPA